MLLLVGRRREAVGALVLVHHLDQLPRIELTADGRADHLSSDKVAGHRQSLDKTQVARLLRQETIVAAFRDDLIEEVHRVLYGLLRMVGFEAEVLVAFIRERSEHIGDPLAACKEIRVGQL